MPTRERAVHITNALAGLRVPLALIDRRGRFRWLNRGATDVVGDLVGEPFSAVIAPEDLESVRDHFSRKLDGEADSTTYTMTLIAKGGDRIPVRVSSMPFWEGDEIVGVFGIVWPVRLGGADGACSEQPATAPALTSRQQQTLELLAEGLGTAELAQRLGIAEETARNHVRALLSALGVHSRLEAVVRGYRLGLVQPRRPD
jgi:PAS domain S-box-containing protein